MDVISISTILKNITGFSAGSQASIENKYNDLWHWFKHCFGFLGDTPHILTVEEYLRLAREIGLQAANNAAGTYVKVRENGDILVYWEPYGNIHGMFMVVQPDGPMAGEVTTLFSPEDGKRYFDFQEPAGPTLH